VEFNRFLYWVFEVFNIDGGGGKGRQKKLFQKRIIEFTCGKST
jgi:hypothetical protein